MSQTYGVIGGGIVGIAIARSLAQRGADVVVVEKEDRLAAHQTGHNSGVVHAGIYYAPGSLKARLCAEGRERTREFCLERGLPYRELGKLVVATDDTELAALARLRERAEQNGVPGLRAVDAAEMREIEPHVGGVAALHSPRTAVVDYTAITRSMADDVTAAGGRIVLGQEVVGISQDAGGVRLRTPQQELRVDRLVAAAGLQSDVVAGLVGGDRSPRILPFRGEYWELDPRRSDLVRGMVYPVPDPRFPFLGVHFTRGVYDDVHIGPSAVPALAREGYRWRDVSARDTLGSLTWPGAPGLFRKHWRMGVKEVSHSLSKRLYFRDAKRFIPELQLSDMTHRTASGVRAQAWRSDGELLDDFAVDSIDRVTILRNAPSPAATSAMAIAEYVQQNFLALR